MQQQPHDERRDEAQFRGLLKEWKAPETPLSLERRVLGSREPRQSLQHRSVWRFLLSGYIRVAAVWRFAVQPPAPCVAAQAVAPENHAAHTFLPNRCEHPAPGVC